MLPTLIDFGPVVIYTYTLFVFGAFFGGLFVMWKRGREVHFEEIVLFDNLLVIGIWALVGARLGYVLIHAADMSWQVMDWINLIAHPGFWFIGGLVSGAVALSVQAKKLKWEVYTLADVVVTGLVLAQAIMALGAFFNGNGAGVVANNWLGVQFMGMYDKRLPVQLYECGLLLVWFMYLWRAEGAYRTYAWYKGTRSEAQSGFITAMYFIGVGVIELLLTLIRPGDITIWSMQIDWLIYLIMVWVGVGILSHRSGGGIVRAWMPKRQSSTRRLNRLKSGVTQMHVGDDIFG